MSVVNATGLSPEDARIAQMVNYLGELLSGEDQDLYMETLSEIFDGADDFESPRDFLVYAFRKVLDGLRLVKF